MHSNLGHVSRHSSRYITFQFGSMGRKATTIFALSVALSVSCAALCAVAETDYRCLHDCTAQQSGSAQACLQSCSYIPAPGTASRPGPGTPAGAASSHAQFSTPAPVAGGVVPASGYTASAAASKPTLATTNYRCVADCQRAWLSRDLCMQRCSHP